MEIIHFNEETFRDNLALNKTMLVDFYATWCGPCRMLSPILDEIRQEVGDDIIIGKVDVDECFDVARTYGVMSVPTLILFKNGEEEKRTIGLKSKQAILDMIGK